MEVLADSLLRSPAIHSRGSGIPELNDSVEVAHDDGLRSKVQEISALPQYVLHLLAFRDVDERANCAANVSNVIEQRIRTRKRLHCSSALQAYLQFNAIRRFPGHRRLLQGELIG